MHEIPTPNDQLVATRTALHRLAAYVIAPTRYAATGRFGLRATPGGFGTPEFEGRRIRVEDRTLIDERPDDVRTSAITSLASAAAFLETEIDPETAAEHDSPPVGDVDADLGLDADSARLLGWWFTTTSAALDLVRVDPSSVDPSETQLWPGHFDPAIEVGDADKRGSYGASPGDDSIAEPYLYLALWWPDRAGFDAADPFWNAPSFSGRVLRLSDFPRDGDPVGTAAAFYREARDHLG